MLRFRVSHILIKWSSERIVSKINTLLRYFNLFSISISLVQSSNGFLYSRILCKPQQIHRCRLQGVPLQKVQRLFASPPAELIPHVHLFVESDIPRHFPWCIVWRPVHNRMITGPGYAFLVKTCCSAVKYLPYTQKLGSPVWTNTSINSRPRDYSENAREKHAKIKLHKRHTIRLLW